MSLISRQAIALALLAMTGTAASAQAPTALFQPGRSYHRMSLPPVPATTTRAFVFGRSLVSAPRTVSGALAGPLVPRVPGEPTIASPLLSPLFSPLLAASDAWTPLGPAALQNAGGAFGAYNSAEGYDGGIGQNTSGRIVGIAADSTSAGTYYIASAGGGVWKTTDAGQSYTALTDFLGDTAMGSITIAPSNHNVIYAGTGEANFAGDSRYGIGLLKSIDGGASWSVIPGPTTTASPQGVFYRKAISRIVVSPTDPNTVYLGTVLAGLNGNGFADGGVWKTTDGGVTWTNTTANKVNNNALYTDVVMNSFNPNILYTTVGYPGTYGGNGVFKTTNGGATWTQLNGGLPLPSSAPVGGQTTLALYPSASGASDTLYVSIPNSNTSGLLGLYKSTDSGVTFTNLNAPDYLTGQSFYDNAIVISPTNPNVFFAAGKVNYAAVGGFGTVNDTNFNNLRTLIGTTDGGATFHDYSLGGGFVGPHTDTHALTFTADGKILDGNDGGIWRLENPLVANPTPPASDTDASTANLQWTDINANLNTLQFTGIALDHSNLKVAYGGAQDNGTSKLSGGVWNQVQGGDGGFTRNDASSPQTVYQEFYGISLQRSDDGGQTFTPIYNGVHTTDAYPDFLEVGSFDDGTDPKAFYVPYKLDPLNQSRIVYSTSNIYYSPDKGGDLSVVDSDGVAGDFVEIGISGAGGNGFAPNVSSTAYVNALGVAGPAIYAEIGSRVFATFNNGASWADRSIPTILAGGVHLSDFYVNPGNPLDVYASKPSFDTNTVSGVSKTISIGKVFRSTNGGVNWTNISSNLPDEPFNSIRLDQKSGTLYAAGDDGVYSSTNYGGSWVRIPGSLPTTQVVDLDVSNPTGILGAGTHGRGLWTTPLSTVVAKPNLKVNPQIGRTTDGKTVVVTLTLSNFGSSALPAGVGNADALNASLSVSLNGQVAAPVVLGPVPAYGNSQSATVTFTNVPAGFATLRYSGTYTGSSFTGTQRVSVP